MLITQTDAHGLELSFRHQIMLTGAVADSGVEREALSPAPSKRHGKIFSQKRARRLQAVVREALETTGSAI